METLKDIREAARHAFASGQLAYSIELYQKILESQKHEQSLDDVVNLGALLRKTKQLKKASFHYKKYIQQFLDRTILVQNACNCWIELKDFDQSRSVLKQSLAKSPTNTALMLSLGFTELSAENAGKASEIFEGILRLDKDHFDAWFNLGVSKAKTGTLDEALECFREANQRQPNHPLLKANIITILQDLGKIKDAWKELNTLDPASQSSETIRAVRASLLMKEEKYDEASHLLKEMTTENPHNARHWINWSTCLKAIKFTVAPKNIIKTGLLWHPENIDLQHSFAQSMAEMGYIESYQKTIDCWERDLHELSNEHVYSQQFLAISSNALAHPIRAKLAKGWERKLLTSNTKNLWADRIQENHRNRPLRIGYLSADWRNHPVGRFMLPILKQHCGKNVEVWCIDGTPSHDWITKQIKQYADHWINIKNLNGLEAARHISNERLDILIELGGFTSHSRLDCLVHRPSPIQLSYLGYPAPTYLDCIDGWIGDQELFSTLSSYESQAHQLLYIEGGYMAFDPGDGIPEPKKAHDVNFRFGCFNHARKLTDQTINLFCEVLNACPDSTLLLKSISFHEEEEKERIRCRFEQQSIDPKRLLMLDWVEGGLNHLECYNQIDVALDPTPYGGATTTAEALWMGVPVITRRDSGMAGCLSTSLLSYGEQKQLVASTKEEYLQIAKDLFDVGQRTTSDRIQLRTAMKQSALADAQRLCRGLESLYLKLHQRVVEPSR